MQATGVGVTPFAYFPPTLVRNPPRGRMNPGSAPHPSPELGGPLIAVPLGPDSFPLGLGLLFCLDEGGAIGLFQILYIGLGHAGGDHLLVHIPLRQPEDGDHPAVAVDVADLHPDGSAG